MPEELLEVSMARGDIHVIHFQVIDEETGMLSDIPFDEIYMSVKKTVYDRDVLFQKKLTDGGIEKITDGDFQVRIDPVDTENLDFRTYPFDIKVIYGNEIKKTYCGELEITSVVTSKWNEV